MPVSINTKLLLGLSLILMLSWPTCGPQECTELIVLEATIRQHVAKQVLPVFPPDAAREEATGVAVAQVLINEKGVPASVQVLQAPHPKIAEATSNAVKQWEFKFYPNEQGPPECFRGKLTFYFVIEDGVPYVRNPKAFQDGKT